MSVSKVFAELNNNIVKCVDLYNSNIYIIRNLILTLIKTIKNNDIVVDDNDINIIFKEYLKTAKNASQLKSSFENDYKIMQRFHKYNRSIFADLTIIKNQLIDDINYQLIILSNKEKEVINNNFMKIRNIGIQTIITEYIIKSKLIIDIIKSYINISDNIFIINNIVFDEFINIIHLSYDKLTTYNNISANFKNIIYNESAKRLDIIKTNTKKRKYTQIETDVCESLISLKNYVQMPSP